MVHSGCNGGKKWQFVITEKCGSSKMIVFDSKQVAEQKWGHQTPDCVLGMRPQRVVDLFEDWLHSQTTFDYENHALYVNSKWFSFASVSKGLRKIGEVFNQPLVFEEGKKDE
jgi:hypothetical protein